VALDAVLLPFKYRESEIEIVKNTGNGPYYVIFKVVAGNKSYHLYVVGIPICAASVGHKLQLTITFQCSTSATSNLC
jgi:hypothetical protein